MINKNSPIIDDRSYTVVGINGYRLSNLTLEQARKKTAHLQEEMKTAGWRGKVRVFYRDGTEVKDGAA